MLIMKISQLEFNPESYQESTCQELPYQERSFKPPFLRAGVYNRDCDEWNVSASITIKNKDYPILSQNETLDPYCPQAEFKFVNYLSDIQTENLTPNIFLVNKLRFVLPTKEYGMYQTFNLDIPDTLVLQKTLSIEDFVKRTYNPYGVRSSFVIASPEHSLLGVLGYADPRTQSMIPAREMNMSKIPKGTLDSVMKSVDTRVFEYSF